jgi:hypothetical protein
VGRPWVSLSLACVLEILRPMLAQFAESLATPDDPTTFLDRRRPKILYRFFYFQTGT